MSVYCEKQFLICEPGDPALTVCPWPDAEGCVVVKTEGDDAEAWYGRTELVMSPAFARALAKALLEIADHVEGK